MAFTRQLSRIKDIVKEKHATGVKDASTRRAMDRLYDELNKMRKMLENVPDGETVTSDTVGNRGSSRMIFDEVDNEYVPEFKTPDGWSRGALQTFTDAKGGLSTPPSLSNELGVISEFSIADRSDNDDANWALSFALTYSALSAPTLSGTLVACQSDSSPAGMEATCANFTEVDSNFDAIESSINNIDSNFINVSKNIRHLAEFVKSIAFQLDDVRYSAYSSQQLLTGTMPNEAGNVDAGYAGSDGSGYGASYNAVSVKTEIINLRNLVTELSDDLKTVKDNQRVILTFLDSTKLVYKLSETAVDSAL